nr:elongation factor P [Candidatus Gracilibacteria bacterium]
MKTAMDAKPGTVLDIDGDLYFVNKWEFHRAGRGATTVKMRLKNISNGGSTDRVFSGEDKLNDVILERTTFEFLYNSSGMYVFMNGETYEQIELNEDDIGDMKYYLTEGNTIDIQQYEGKFVGIILPTYVKLKISEVDLTSSGTDMKDAVTTTGLQLSIPQDIEIGDEVVVNTSTGEFMEKVK